MSSSLPPAVPTKGRLGSRIKSNNGCLTCKIRRVKCGEERPFCHRCLSTKRKCDGYAHSSHPRSRSAAVSSTSLAQASSPPNFPDVEQDEIQVFEFFIYAVLPGCTRFVDQQFWHHIIPQLSRSEKIIWDAVNAIACLVRHPQFSRAWILPGQKEKPMVTDDHHRRALKWYNKSLHGLQKRIGQGSISPGILMVTCLLYTCVECLQDNLHEAILIYQQAIAITTSILSTATTDRTSSQAVPPVGSLENTTQALLRHMSITQATPTSWATAQSGLNKAFESFSDAREVGYGIIAETHQFVCQVQEIKLANGKDWLPSSDLIYQRDGAKTRLLEWKCAMDKLAERPGFLDAARLDQDENELYAVLRLAYTHYFIFLSSSLSTFETTLDDFFPHFRSMIEDARVVVALQKARSQRPVFVLETRIIPALHYVATRCRHPIIRRQAIEMLENDTPRMEYYFKAEAMAQVAKRIVGIEEAGGNELGVFHSECPLDRVDMLPAEDHRIYREKLMELSDPTSRESVQFLAYGIWRRQSGGDGSWTPTEHIIRI